jgi:hypothetical protein
MVLFADGVGYSVDAGRKAQRHVQASIEDRAIKC